jgi:hypothetical protein
LRQPDHCDSENASSILSARRKLARVTDCWLGRPSDDDDGWRFIRLYELYDDLIGGGDLA